MSDPKESRSFRIDISYLLLEAKLELHCSDLEGLLIGMESP